MRRFTSLENFIKYADKKSVESVLLANKTKIFLNGLDQNILHLLARFKRHKVLIHVIKYFSNLEIDQPDKNGNTPFLLAAQSGNIKNLTVLKEHGANINHSNNYNETALHFASLNGNVVMVQKLVDWGLTINTKSIKGGTPPMISAYNCYKKVLEYLLDYQAEVNICRKYKSAICHALFNIFESINSAEILDIPLNFILKTTSGSYNEIIPDLEAALYFALKHENTNSAKTLFNCDIIKNPQNYDIDKTVLMISAINGHQKVLVFLLENGANVDIKCRQERTALFYAVLNGHQKCVKALSEFNADVNTRDFSEITPLMEAARLNYSKILQYLLLFGADISAVCKNKHNAFHYAAYNGSLKCLQWLKNVGKKENIIYSNICNATALHFASQQGHLKVVEQLVVWGLNVNTQIDNSNETPLMLAAQNGHSNVIRYLLNNGAKGDIPCKKGITALWYTVLHGHEECVRTLLEYDLNVDFRDRAQKTPLMMASKFNYSNILKYLLLKGANVNAKCTNKRNALHYAAFNRNLECVEELIKSGSKVDEVDNFGKTALVSAVLNNDKEVVTCLLNNKANPDMQSKIGRSALHYAAEQGYYHICSILTDFGANIDLQDIVGLTPLILAATKGYVSAVKCLLDKGANIHIKDSKGRTALISIASVNTNNLQKSFYQTIESEENPIVNLQKTINYIILHKVNVDDQCFLGLTALHYASKNGKTELVKSLLNFNPNVDAVDLKCETALHKAASQGHDEIIVLLLQKEARENKKSVDGKTAYQLACENNHNHCFWLFAQAANEEDFDYPQLLIRYKKQYKMFRKKDCWEFLVAVIDALKKYINNESKSLLQFRSVKIWKGYLLVTAVDQISLQWLIKELTNITINKKKLTGLIF